MTVPTAAGISKNDDATNGQSTSFEGQRVQMTAPLQMNIVGVVRNGGQGLIDTLARVAMLKASIESCRVVIVTNDNTDGTDEALDLFASEQTNVDIICQDGMLNSFHDRVERISQARNMAMRALFQSASVYPLTLVLDLDGPNVALDPLDVIRAAQRQAPQWDAVFCNTDPAYYDLYALRCRGWIEEDIWQHIWSQRKPLFFRKKWRRRLMSEHVFARQYRIERGTSLIPVESAFGGLGLYRTRCFEGIQYCARDAAGQLTCEHVTLHAQMRLNGALLFIDPDLRALAPAEHMGLESGRPIPSHLLS